MGKSRAEFWSRCAIAFQEQLERDGYAVDVGHERGISFTTPTGQQTLETGETGRNVLNIDPSEAWPKAGVLDDRELSNAVPPPHAAGRRIAGFCFVVQRQR